MTKLTLIRKAIDSFDYIDIDRKNLEDIEAEIREEERKRCANILVNKLYSESYYKESYRDDFLKMFSEDKEGK